MPALGIEPAGRVPCAYTGYLNNMWSDARNLSLSYAARPGSIVEARQALSEFAAAAGAEQRQVDAVRLACSEALTNAVLHAYRGVPGSGEVHVTAALVSQELWVLIADDGCGMEPSADRPGLGFGLALITQLSDSVTIVPRATGGTEVRMRFSLVTASEPEREPGASGAAGHERGSVASASSPA
jgi:anti-sigma regulatory factor (Ser/Thr protein kinase)